jgi:uncharacterized protein YjiS (DUF1127 family)
MSHPTSLQLPLRSGHKQNSGGSGTRKNASALLRDDHIALLVMDAVLAFHASFKKWRSRRRTLRALADLDERQLRDIGLTRDHTAFEVSPRLLGTRSDYRVLDKQDH